MTIINNFFPRERLDYYTKTQGLDKEPKLAPKLAGPLHKIITTTNLHPVKVGDRLLYLLFISTLLWSLNGFGCIGPQLSWVGFCRCRAGRLPWRSAVRLSLKESERDWQGWGEKCRQRWVQLKSGFYLISSFLEPRQGSQASVSVSLSLAEGCPQRERTVSWGGSPWMKASSGEGGSSEPIAPTLPAAGPGAQAW